ncbi:Gfo/Idh/MocA family oxidoreductase [Parasalinivibrio latis]|uniref:Gfo/Idh/MocA family protein n=1 Tax=Parasalinivibrio latis TaxID=2952610 RepID=UPI0030E4406F
MKIGIVGLGDIARKAYLPVITTLENLELVFCTRSQASVKELAQKYRIAEYTTDYRELPKLGVDAVMIHAATRAHVEIASFFLQQGIPVFVDKPLADDANSVEQLYELAEKRNQPLYIGFNRRHIPLFNHYVPELANGECGDLFSLRWEKHRFDLPGELRTFIFDDFIHPLDSVNLNARANVEDVCITHHMQGSSLARLDVQWQAGNTLIQASMNRQFGRTTERVAATYQNRAYEFDSFVEGKCWKENTETRLALKDWTPMLAGKGFEHMVADWLRVAESGRLDTRVVNRNIASHQLADDILRTIQASLV